MDKEKQEIIERFNDKVRGRSFDPSMYNQNHDGKGGHWLEIQMGIKPNGKNESDLLGYEMKNDTTSKTTFGDWSPDLALWKIDTPSGQPRIDRDTEFLKYFGKPNMLKKERLSWSGEPAPTIYGFNKFGQVLRIDENQNILACYSFIEDKRQSKATLIPKEFQQDNLIIAKWLKESIKGKLERKFNNKGWFKCYKDQSGHYNSIGFGEPMNYNNWIKLVAKGTVFFDSGMYAGNPRPYAQWRASNNYWENLVTERY